MEKKTKIQISVILIFFIGLFMGKLSETNNLLYWGLVIPVLVIIYFILKIGLKGILDKI
jgi:hypothetical protein